MKKMNKTLRFLCSALVLILLASALFSCTKKPEAAETETGTDTEAPETATALTVNGVALSEYTIVYARKQATGAEKAADRLNKKLEALCGTVLNKDIKSQADRYEILIGVDGGDADIAAAYESSEGAMLGASGKKIVLLGSNGKLLCDVVDAFLSKVKADGEKQSISVEGNEFFKVTTLPLNVMTYNILFNIHPLELCLGVILAIAYH